MNSNKLIYGGVGIAIVFLAILYFSTGDLGENDNKVQQVGSVALPVKIDSIVGDTTADSYASLQQTIQKSIQENEIVTKTNKELNYQIKQMKVQLEQLATRQSLLDSTRASTGTQSVPSGGLIKEQESINDLTDKQKLIDLTNNYTPKSTKSAPNLENSNFQLADSFNFEESLGLSKFSATRQPERGATRNYDKNDINAGWIMPIETKPTTKGQLTGTNKPKSLGDSKIEKDEIYPAMTISDNSILYDMKALTYLVGRIPVGGRVADPYPVKLIVGSEILIANGHNLPGIEGMFFSGYATGDMNLSCVRAEMNSYTFVFEDGRKVSFRETPSVKGGKEPMAYISDRFGLPCVVGDFVSNVAEFLTIQTSLSAFSVAGEAYAAAQTTVGTTALGGGTSAVTGDTGKYVLGNVASSATEDIKKWFFDRQTNSFDAIVVKSGADVSLHLNRDIAIDYDEAARKIDYRFRAIDKVSLD